MKNIILKRLATAIVAVVTLFTTLGCSDENDNYTSDTRAVAYAFTFNQATVTIGASISYVDYVSPEKTINVAAPESWSYSYTASSSINPFIIFTLYKDPSLQYKESDFPATIGFTASVADGTSVNSVTDTLEFDTLEEFNDFLEDEVSNYYLVSVATVS